jgi:hypothetical protein
MLIWEEVKCEKQDKSFFSIGMSSLWRTKVPGGWLVRIMVGEADSAFFYPDPEHVWDGSSLP